MNSICRRTVSYFFAVVSLFAGVVHAADDAKTVRVFIFAGQSNMVGSDSKVKDIGRFPPFLGLDKPQEKVRFVYNIGRQRKTISNGWVALQPVNGIVGPELSFARRVTRITSAPVAIIKCAAGGTHLGGDWNPDNPQGFKMYPLALELVRSSLAKLKEKGVPYRLEGFAWHQGENDMFNPKYMANYGNNLTNYVAAWRRDLKAPKLRFYVGELCTKTIWGMDLRPRMYAISKGQKTVAQQDPLVDYVPTAHIGVEIGGGVGLHYHYGTLGQLEHGVNYADAYLRNIGKLPVRERKLKAWPYNKGSKVKLFVLAGHRNMEGERAFTQELRGDDRHLLNDDHQIAFRYSLGDGYKRSKGWEPLGPAGYYDTFGPELSFGNALKQQGVKNFAIAKFTHSGSQMNDWTPEGSMAKSRHIYGRFLEFVRETVRDLEQRGHEVELSGIVYHMGENEMSMPPYRRKVPEWLDAMIRGSRRDLKRQQLRWFVSQQPPTDDKRVNNIDVTTEIKRVVAKDPMTTYVPAFDLPKQDKKLVINTAGIVELGRVLAKGVMPKPRTQ